MTIDGAPGSTALARYTYRHDGAGNITGIHDTLAPEYHRHFAYDDLNRLTVANTGPNATPDRPQRSTLWGKGSYTWDAMGNLRSLKLGEIEPNTDPEPLRRPPKPPTIEANVPQGRSSSFTYDGPTPRLTGVATNDVLRSVTHDAVGNETSYFATRTYSPRNVLSTVTDTANSEDTTNVHAIAYVADGRGIRAIRAESPSNGVGTTARRYFTYSPELHLLSVTRDDSTNVWEPDAYPQPGLAKNVFQEIVWFGDRPVGQVNPGLFTRYTIADHLGTPFMQTDAARAVVWRVEYEPFGNVYAVRTGNRTEQPLRFPGQELASTWEGPEENYNIFRWYRAGWGRYTQSDPIGLRGGTNLYAYVEGNPINFTDPLGLKVYKCCRYVQVNPFIDLVSRVFGLRHCFLKTDTREGGMGPAADGPLPAWPFGIPTAVRDHRGQSQQSGTTCTEIRGVDEQCVNNALTEGCPTGPWATDNNCNTFVDQVLNRCNPCRQMTRPAPGPADDGRRYF